jgi:Protein of unknown function (DUF2892)
MNKNIRLWDRSLRYLLGIIFLTWAIAGGPTWTYVGIYLLITASFGSCLIYWGLRINSRS